MAKKDKMNEIRSILSEDNDFIKPLLSKMIHKIDPEGMKKAITEGSCHLLDPEEGSPLLDHSFNSPTFTFPLRVIKKFSKDFNF